MNARTPVSDLPLPEELRTAIAAAGENALNRELDRTLAYDEVRKLADAGLGRLRTPVEAGGLGLSWVDTTEVLVELAAQDSNIPQIFRGHFAVQEDVLWRGPQDEVARGWLKRISAGDLAGNAWTEPGKGGFHESGTVVSQTQNGPVVNGVKYYTTGSILPTGSTSLPGMTKAMSWALWSNVTSRESPSVMIGTASGSGPLGQAPPH